MGERCVPLCFCCSCCLLSLYLLGEVLRVLREALNVHDEVLWQLGNDVLPFIAIHHLLRSLEGTRGESGERGERGEW